MKRRLATSLALALVACSERDSGGERVVVMRFAAAAAIGETRLPFDPALLADSGAALLAASPPVLELDGRSEWRYGSLANELGSGEVVDLAARGGSLDDLRRERGSATLVLPPGTGCFFSLDVEGAEPVHVTVRGSFEPGSSLGLTAFSLDDPSPALTSRIVPGSVRERLRRSRLGSAVAVADGSGGAAIAMLPLPREARSVLLVVAAGGTRYERVDSVAVRRLSPLEHLAASGALRDGMFAEVETGRIARRALVVPGGATFTTREFTIPPRGEFRAHLAAAAQRATAPEVKLDLRLDDGTVVPLHHGAPPLAPFDWLELRSDLEGHAGRRAVIAITAAPGAGDAARIRPPLAWIGEPVLLGASGAAPPFDVVLISIDTLRADRLGAYGNERGLTPHLDALASRATTFAAAYAPAPWTLPSHASMFSGLWPPAHGVEDNRSRVPDTLPVLAESLAAAGFRTAGFTAGGYVSRGFGFARGFDRFCEVDPVGELYFPGEMPTRARFPDGDAGSLRRALAFLDAGRGVRSFLFLHTFVVHCYLPPRDLAARFSLLDEDDPPLDFDTARRFEPERVQRDGLDAADRQRMIDAYDATVVAADRMVGDVVRFLADTGRLDTTLLIVTSDHGQELLERGGSGHGVTLHEESLRVPLLLGVPQRGLGRVVAAPVSLVDLTPTILDALGLPPLPDAQGSSLLPAVDGAEFTERAILATVRDPARSMRESLRRGRYKLLRSRAAPELAFVPTAPLQLFDLEADPGELEDLAGREADRAARLGAELDAALEACAARLAQIGKMDVAPLSPEIRAQLEALGYLGGG
jgi:arylsulfatase A-like enzyme